MTARVAAASPSTGVGGLEPQWPFKRPSPQQQIIIRPQGLQRYRPPPSDSGCFLLFSAVKRTSSARCVLRGLAMVGGRRAMSWSAGFTGTCQNSSLASTTHDGEPRRSQRRHHRRPASTPQSHGSTFRAALRQSRLRHMRSSRSASASSCAITRYGPQRARAGAIRSTFVQN